MHFRGNVKFSTMISKVGEYNNRSEFILSVMKNELEKNPNQQILFLAHRKSLLTYMFKAIEHRNIASVGFYIGGMKERDLKESENKTIILATFQMAEEGLDIKIYIIIIFKILFIICLDYFIFIFNIKCSSFIKLFFKNFMTIYYVYN